MYTRFLISILFLGRLGFAVGVPGIPAGGEDLKLTGGLSAQKFFEARQQNTACRAQLKDAQDKYFQSRKELRALIEAKSSASEIDAKEAESLRNRISVLAKMEDCGDCKTQPLEKRVINGSPTQVWYITDGSCYFNNEDNQKNSDAYNRGIANLLNTGKYAKPDGGFQSILTFIGIDTKTGAVLPPAENVASPFTAYIVVEGPTFPFIGKQAFGYIFKNDFAETAASDLKEFNLRFNSVDNIPGFSKPRVYQVSASGKKKSVTVNGVRTVQGMWYVNSNGYFRYYTAADFGRTVPITDKFARNTLLDTVLNLAERSNQEE